MLPVEIVVRIMRMGSHTTAMRMGSTCRALHAHYKLLEKTFVYQERVPDCSAYMHNTPVVWQFVTHSPEDMAIFIRCITLASGHPMCNVDCKLLVFLHTYTRTPDFVEDDSDGEFSDGYDSDEERGQPANTFLRRIGYPFFREVTTLEDALRSFCVDLSFAHNIIKLNALDRVDGGGRVFALRQARLRLGIAINW